VNETQRKRRGHNFLPPKAVLGKTPMLRTTDGIPFDDKTIWVHYFCAAGDWWIAELDAETGEAFGYTSLSASPEGAEWGYVSLEELEQVNAHHGLVIVERDCYWEPVKFSEVKP
jgi:hypothetical protein